jgi:hypothetical protein
MTRRNRFRFGIDDEPSNEPYPRFRSNTTGIRITPFGGEINGIPEAEIATVQAEARKRLDKMDQANWRDLAAKCWKIGAIQKPRLREMAAKILLGGMHGGDPEDLEEYAKNRGISPIEAADERSPAGGFTETPRGIVQGETTWNNDDLPEENEEDDGGEFDIPQVEA